MSLREQLQTIYDDHGRLTPAIVVDVARAKDHPLHSMVFNVPKGEAAERYYLSRASEIICSVRVVYRKQDTDQRIDVRAFHAVTGPEGHSYEPVDAVVNDPLLLALVLRDMERQWRELHGRYSQFKEFAEMVLGSLEATG